MLDNPTEMHSIKRLGSEVSTIGPNDRCGLRVDSNLRKVRRVVEWLKDALPFHRGEVHISSSSVIEKKPKPVFAYHGDANHGG